MSINMEVSCYNISWLIKSVILTTENFRWITKNMINQSYEELILFNNNDAIHQRHWRYFALEVFKCLMHLNPVFLWSYINRNSIACTSRSVLAPVLFNLYLNDLFHFATLRKFVILQMTQQFHACDNDLNNLSKR